MGFSIGFDSGGGGRSDEGVLGSLGRSISGAMSPAAEGFGGSVRAFLNPGPTLRREEREQQLASVRPVMQQVADMGQKVMRQYMAGDEEGALMQWQGVKDYATQHGMDLGDSMLTTLDRLLGAKTAHGLQELSAGTGALSGQGTGGDTSPVGMARGAMKFIRDPLQFVTGAGHVQDILQGKAATDVSEENLRQSQGLYPGKVAEQKQGLEKGREEIETENLRQTNLGYEGAGIQARTADTQADTAIKNLEKESITNKGYRIPTGPPKASGVGTEVDDIQAKQTEGQGLIKYVNTGQKGMVPGTTKYYDRPQVEPSIGLYNQGVARLKSIYPNSPLKYLELEDVPITRVPDTTKKGEFVTLGGGVRVRETEQAPGQEQEQGQAQTPGQAPARGVKQPKPGAPPSLDDLTALTPGGGQIPDRDIMNMDFDERMIPERAQGQVKQLKNELQAALKAARSDQERQQLVVRYGNQIRQAMAAGAQGQ